MSQNTFPFADGEDEELETDEASRNRKALIVAGGVAAALVLGAGGWLLLGGGGSSGSDAAFVVPHHAAKRAAAAPPKTAEKVKSLPAPYKEQLGRDPFHALYVIPAAAPSAAPSGAAVVPGTVVVPGSVPITAPATGTTGDPGTTPVAPANQEYKLVLMRVYGTGADRTAVFSIDGKQQVAKIGAKFGPTSEIVLLSIQQGPKAGQWTTVLQVGDGDPFDVVTAVPAYVR